MTEFDSAIVTSATGKQKFSPYASPKRTLKVRIIRWCHLVLPILRNYVIVTILLGAASPNNLP